MKEIIFNEVLLKIKDIIFKQRSHYIKIYNVLIS